MNELQFAYWLKGFVEMNPEAMITHTQWLILKDHLNLVFKKETPSRETPLRTFPITTPPPMFPMPSPHSYPGTMIC